MQNTNNNSNQTGIQTQTGVTTLNNIIHEEQLQCNSVIDFITENLKSSLFDNLGTPKHDLMENLRKYIRLEITTVIEQIDYDILSLGDRDLYYGP